MQTTETAAPNVLIVLTDEERIFVRDEVPADEADAAIARRNLAIIVPEFRWRRAITFREPLNVICQGCGSRSCWCGRSRSLHRSEIARP